MEKSSSGGGIGLSALLQVAFVVLKLLKVINWSWWWVLAPTWISVAIAVIIGVIAFLLATKKD